MMMKDNFDEPYWLTEQQVCKLLQVGRTTLTTTLPKRGFPPPVYIDPLKQTGKRYVRHEVIAWADQQRSEQNPSRDPESLDEHVRRLSADRPLGALGAVQAALGSAWSASRMESHAGAKRQH